MSMNYASRYPRFWLGYFALSVIVLAVNAVTSVPSMLESGGPGRLAGCLYGLVALWPLYGFIRHRRYNPRWLWQLLFGSAGLATLGVIVACLFTAFATATALPVLAAVAFAFVGCPYLVALHQYLYRSPDLWA
jgi:hypothetical protein